MQIGLGSSDSLPLRKVFIVYKGNSYCESIARAVDRCLWTNGIETKVALQGTRGEIQVNSERDIFNEERRCDAVVAINTKGRTSRKFSDEVELAKYKFKQPVVALIQKGSRPSLLFSVGTTWMRFAKWTKAKTCRELVRVVRKEIELSRPAGSVPIGKALPRRSLDV